MLKIVRSTAPAALSTPPSLGQRLASLLSRISNPRNFPEHARIAAEIRETVKGSSHARLEQQLEFLSQAREKRPMGLAEMTCAREAQVLCELVGRMKNVPWEELRLALGLGTMAARSTPPPPTARERACGVRFANSRLVAESNLTVKARTFLQDLVRTQCNVWSDPAVRFRSIEQDADWIIIEHSWGETTLYIRPH